jgi:exodeoxyribonuclease VII large subunit
MDQLNFFTPTTWSVSDITHYLREILTNDQILQDIWILGEVSNLSRPSSGHIYFTLKDAHASLRCAMWRSTTQQQKWLPKEGDAIEVHGLIDIYEAGGQYQLYADLIRPAGEGVLFQKFLRLKNKLEQEGLFDPDRKKAIPKFPHCIGIVTSPTGAAIQDILTTIKRRYPLVEVVLSPTAVQGENAAQEIVSALYQLQTLTQPDLIILARGGGSIEDLMPFNSEIVARAIAASSIPIITGIGHETDFTIADFTSDLRAATPTAAAELATPDGEELRFTVTNYSLNLNQSFHKYLVEKRNNLNAFLSNLNFFSPRIKLRDNRQRIDDLTHRLIYSSNYQMQLERTKLNACIQKFESLNPASILERGYSIVSDQYGNLVKKLQQVKKDDHISIQVSDGKFSASVE